MNDDYTQDGGVTGDYSAPQTHEDYSAPQPEEQTGSYGQSDTQAGTYQQQTGSYDQNDTKTGAFQQETGSFGQSSSQDGTYQQNYYQNSYSNAGADSYTSINTNPKGNDYSNPYQQNSTNQSQNLYYGQAMQDKGDSIGFGVASMVLGILSMLTFCCCVNYIFAVLAIIFGIVQMVKSNKKGMAVTGIITAAISIIISIIFWIAAYSGGAEYNLKEYQEKILEQEFTGV